MSGNTTTTEAPLETIRTNYFEALENEDMDLAAAGSDARRTMITANVRSARQIYWDAKANQLSEQGQAVQDAHDAAKAANAAVKKAREQSETIATIVKLAIGATDAAGDLLDAAKKAT
jgi:hypothetical protein